MTFNKDVLAKTEKAGFRFFVTDLDLAMTLTRIASDSQEDSQKRDRNQASARQAYDSISRISARAVLNDKEREQVKEKLNRLRSALERLGEVFT